VSIGYSQDLVTETKRLEYLLDTYPPKVVMPIEVQAEAISLLRKIPAHFSEPNVHPEIVIPALTRIGINYLVSNPMRVEAEVVFIQLLPNKKNTLKLSELLISNKDDRAKEYIYTLMINLNYKDCLKFLYDDFEDQNIINNLTTQFIQKDIRALRKSCSSNTDWPNFESIQYLLFEGDRYHKYFNANRMGIVNARLPQGYYLIPHYISDGWDLSASDARQVVNLLANPPDVLIENWAYSILMRPRLYSDLVGYIYVDNYPNGSIINARGGSVDYHTIYSDGDAVWKGYQAKLPSGDRDMLTNALIRHLSRLAQQPDVTARIVVPEYAIANFAIYILKQDGKRLVPYLRSCLNRYTNPYCNKSEIIARINVLENLQ
jgi:hypothetical protein